MFLLKKFNTRWDPFIPKSVATSRPKKLDATSLKPAAFANLYSPNLVAYSTLDTKSAYFLHKGLPNAMLVTFFKLEVWNVKLWYV